MNEAQRTEEPDGLTRRSFGITVKSLDQANRSVRVIASSEHIDAHGDIVEQSWVLDRYKANPVVLFNHNRGAGWNGNTGDALPIGSASAVEVVDGKLEATLRFVDEKAHPLAEQVWQGFLQGSLRAVSVGFNPNDIDAEMDDGVTVYHLRNNELFEISVCPMGSNPEAVAKTADADRVRFKALAHNSRSASEGRTKKVNTMDLEQHQKALDTVKGELAVASKALEVATAKNVELEKTVETVTVELGKAREGETAAKKSLEVIETKLVEAEVDALIGTKLAPAEKEDMIELRSSNPVLFAKMMKARPDTIGVGADPVLGKDKSGAPAPTSNGEGEDLASLITEGGKG